MTQMERHHDVHFNIENNGVHKYCETQPRNYNNACVLAIARAVPDYKINQPDYADFYFKITKCEHKTDLKKKMDRICERSGVQTRYSIMTEEFLKSNPEIYTPGEPSLELRHKFLAEEVPKLAHVAGAKALQEWGRPASEITHLVVVTISGIAMPGADVKLIKSLGLQPNVGRVMLYMLGCYAGVTALRVSKDIAENNPGSRVLICCSELSVTTFRAPDEKSPYNLVGAALFGDGAAGVIVGTHPRTKIEKSIYEIHAAMETIIPNTENIIEGKMKIEGLQFYLDKQLPLLISTHVADFCKLLLKDVPGKPDLGDVFWAVHAGGPAILNAVEEAATLRREKLQASRHILANYGNVSASTVLFVMDELRKSTFSKDDCEWGIAIAFGPGVTFEGVLLRRV